MAESGVLGGTILRGDDGTWFYIRDDKLDQFKVKDDETIAALTEIAQREEEEVSGFAFLPAGPATFETPKLNNIGFNNLALRANFGLGIGTC
jgi:hypothetical protein